MTKRELEAVVYGLAAGLQGERSAIDGVSAAFAKGRHWGHQARLSILAEARGAAHGIALFHDSAIVAPRDPTGSQGQEPARGVELARDLGRSEVHRARCAERLREAEQARDEALERAECAENRARSMQHLAEMAEINLERCRELRRTRG